MKTNFFSQLAMRVIALEEIIEETMYFALASSIIGDSLEIKKIRLPNLLLGEVRKVVTSPYTLNTIKIEKKRY